MRVYEKAIIIDEPWISLILRGEKVWELRSKRTRFTGPVGLIRKGSGTVVGTARLVGCLQPLSAGELSIHEPLHRVLGAEQRAAVEIGRVIPWVLRDALPLSRPVAYPHRSGQQIWVLLDSEVDAAIQSAAHGSPANHMLSVSSLQCAL